MPFDTISYIMGEEKGKTEAAGKVILTGDQYDFTDANNDGHVVITEKEGGE